MRTVVYDPVSRLPPNPIRYVQKMPRLTESSAPIGENN